MNMIASHERDRQYHSDDQLRRQQSVGVAAPALRRLLPADGSLCRDLRRPAEGYAYLIGIQGVIAPLATDGWLHLASMHNDTELRRYGTRPAGLHHGKE
jgi:hypothetical protein